MYRIALGILLCVLAICLDAPLVYAHDPIILQEDQKEPNEGPFFPDARISFAVYGEILDSQDRRGFEFRIPSKDSIQLSLLVPDLAPENTFPISLLPNIELRRPDGTMLQIESTSVSLFSEPFTNTKYLRLADHEEIGEEGVYSVLVSGSRASRFTVAIGYLEIFGTPVSNVMNRDEGIQGVRRWYETPPRSSADLPVLEEGRSSSNSLLIIAGFFTLSVIVGGIVVARRRNYRVEQ